MPTLVETIGAASANTYVALEQSNDYAAGTMDASRWLEAGEDSRTAALLTSCRILTGLNWQGRRVNNTQALPWPRYECPKADATTGGDYCDRLFYLTTEIPQRVKDAQCELAIALIKGTYCHDGGPAVESFKVDGMETKYANPERANDLPRSVADLIAPLLAGNRLRRA